MFERIQTDLKPIDPEKYSEACIVTYRLLSIETTKITKGWHSLLRSYKSEVIFTVLKFILAFIGISNNYAFKTFIKCL